MSLLNLMLMMIIIPVKATMMLAIKFISQVSGNEGNDEDNYDDDDHHHVNDHN